ncbi:MAG: alpha/beta hydrolase [Roseicyclus sp.]|nr:alpha/beta hydrolase [Roseicyclus sp.]
MRDWDAAFNNMAHVEGSGALPAFWAARAAEYRATAPVEEDIPYGDHPRERFDLVWPEGPPKGLAVFVHGGYWMRLDKSFWTDFAEGARVQGWAVCLPSYTLAPEARIGVMTGQIARAVMVAAGRVDGPIRLSGHSAGGHLVSRMLCDDSPLDEATLARISHTLSISGLHDLRPLLQTKMNETLHLDTVEAARESAVLHMPRPRTNLTTWAGGGELPEFIRQARLLAMMWDGLGARTRCRIDGSHNHFTVIEGLKDPTSPITKSLIGSKEDMP